VLLEKFGSPGTHEAWGYYRQTLDYSGLTPEVKNSEAQENACHRYCPIPDSIDQSLSPDGRPCSMTDVQNTDGFILNCEKDSINSWLPTVDELPDLGLKVHVFRGEWSPVRHVLERLNRLANPIKPDLCVGFRIPGNPEDDRLQVPPGRGFDPYLELHDRRR
jgi:hypothetical protein